MVVNLSVPTNHLYASASTYTAMAMASCRDIHKLAVQTGISVDMLEKFYSKVSARMNAAEDAGWKRSYTICVATGDTASWALSAASYPTLKLSCTANANRLFIA